MTQEKIRCPNCGRQLTEDEIYCYFCELDISNFAAAKKKSQKKR